MFFKCHEVSSYPPQHEHHTWLDREGKKKKSSFTLEWNINRAKQQPINTKIQQIHQHSIAFTDAWDSHLLLLAAEQCFPSSCQPELNSGCYWPLVCSWILSALFEIFWFAWRTYKDPTLRSSMNLYKTVPVSGVCWPFRHGCYSGDLWVEEFSIGTCESSELIITTGSFLCLNARFDWVAFCFCPCCILFSLVTWSRYDFIPVYIKEFKVQYLSLDLENRIAQYCTAFLTFLFYHYPSVSSVTIKFSWTFVSTIVVSFGVGFLRGVPVDHPREGTGTYSASHRGCLASAFVSHSSWILALSHHLNR